MVRTREKGRAHAHAAGRGVLQLEGGSTRQYGGWSALHLGARGRPLSILGGIEKQTRERGSDEGGARLAKDKMEQQNTLNETREGVK